MSAMKEVFGFYEELRAIGLNPDDAEDEAKRRFNRRKQLRGWNEDRLYRLYGQVFERMTRHDGYQPFGYDRRTLQLTKPIWLMILDDIHESLNEIQDGAGDEIRLTNCHKGVGS